MKNEKRMRADVWATFGLINNMFGDPRFKEYKNKLLTIRKYINQNNHVTLAQKYEVEKIFYLKGNNSKVNLN